MKLTQTTLEESLNTFREHFRSIHVRQDQDYLVYNYKNIRHATVSCSEANNLIYVLNLPLVAIHSQNSTSFFVKSNEISDI